MFTVEEVEINNTAWSKTKPAYNLNTALYLIECKPLDKPQTWVLGMLPILHSIAIKFEIFDLLFFTISMAHRNERNKYGQRIML